MSVIIQVKRSNNLRLLITFLASVFNSIESINILINNCISIIFLPAFWDVIINNNSTDHLTMTLRPGTPPPSGENLTFGTLATRQKPAETLESARYHLLGSDH